MRHSWFVKILPLLLFVSALGGCISKPKVAPVEITYLEHRVRYEGETLGIITKWYTGKSGAWEEVLTYNPGLDVRRMRAGDTVRIPTSMLKRTDPLPLTVVTKVRATPKIEEPGIGEEVALIQTSEPPSEAPQSASEVVATEEQPLVQTTMQAESPEMAQPALVVGATSDLATAEKLALETETSDVLPAPLESELHGTTQPKESKRIPSREELWKALKSE